MYIIDRVLGISCHFVHFLPFIEKIEKSSKFNDLSKITSHLVLRPVSMSPDA